MPWLPEWKTTSRKRLRDNLIAYWTANQVEALAWAKSELGLSATPVLTPLVAFYKSTVGRALTNFPHGMVVSARTSEAELDIDDDTVEAVRHTFVFEFEIAGTNAETLTDDVEAYVTAFDSVVRNIPKATLLANVGRVAGGILRVAEVDPDVLRGQLKDGLTGDWLKVPQITVTIDLIEGISNG